MNEATRVAREKQDRIRNLLHICYAVQQRSLCEASPELETGSHGALQQGRFDSSRAHSVNANLGGAVLDRYRYPPYCQLILILGYSDYEEKKGTLIKTWERLVSVKGIML